MSKNFILEQKNLLTKKECNYLIKECKKRTQSAEHKDHGYVFFDLEGTQTFVELTNLILPILKKYVKKYPEVNLTKNKWALTNMRFKHFKPNKFFEKFHSEHSWEHSTRILNVQIYLSDHNCGTEFFDGKVIKSEQGKVAIFPSYFTHTHKGQISKTKEKYIMTGWYTYNV